MQIFTLENSIFLYFCNIQVKYFDFLGDFK